MSFLSKVFSGINKLFNKSTGSSSMGSTMLQTVTSGITLRKLYATDQKQTNSPTPTSNDPDNPYPSINTSPPDQGVRLQTSADTANKINIVYGEAFTQGKLIDAEMASDNKTMYYVLVLSEKTGTTIAGDQSVFTFRDIYINNMRCVFQADGVTVDYTQDRNEFQDNSLKGLCEVYCYAGNSNTQVGVEDFATPTPTAAYSVMPSWTSTDAMNDLIFVVVKLQYAPGKNMTQLPSITAHLSNSMNQPGDVLYDYMTNTRYGAGIDLQEIYLQ